MSDVLLEVRGLVKRFGPATVLDGIDLQVRRGEVVVIIGPSGCGKSTLLRCIDALEPIQQGEILLEGDPVLYGRKDLVRTRQKIGMVFQSYDLFPHLTVLGNVTLAPRKVQKRDREEVRQEALALLERVGLRDRAQSRPRELSGGQKQRVAIVRALCMRPDLLLFDEVTAALDPEMVREVLDVMLDLARAGRTMLIVTHEMSFARAIADRVLFLDGGHVVEEGPPSQIFTRPRTERARKFLDTFRFDAVKDPDQRDAVEERDALL